MDVLAVGAHPDDVNVGCGGTLAKHADRGDEVVFLHLTAGGPESERVESGLAEKREGGPSDR